MKNVSASYLDLPTSSAARSTNTSSSQPQNSSTSTDRSVNVTISDEALRRLGLAQKEKTEQPNLTGQTSDELTTDELNEVKELKARDKQVHDHERAHMMAGGSLVRKGASYQYTTGPDGQRYAVAGEVSIDTSEVKDNPSATISKMQQVKRSALAPTNPSSQDRAVAASAAQKDAQARQEVRQQSSA